MKPITKTIEKESILVLGVPFDKNSSFLEGPCMAPDRIRESYFSKSSNLTTENGLDLNAIPCLYDMGNLDFSGGKNEFDQITEHVGKALARATSLVTLGGDHSITFPVITAYAQKYTDLNILHLDAHPDLYDNLDENPLSHASPFARIMENKLAKRLVQGGIRTMNKHQKEQAEKWGVEVNEMKDGVAGLLEIEFEGPVYLSLDMDCLDPAFAPGVSHHEPGGMTTREVIGLIQGLKGKLIGGDIVEYNPHRDLFSMTSMVAAKFLKEMIARIYRDNR